LEEVDKYEILACGARFFGNFETQIMNLKLFLFLQMDCHWAMGFVFTN
jgi:hypothetical protein